VGARSSTTRSTPHVAALAELFDGLGRAEADQLEDLLRGILRRLEEREDPER
jgi:hypothetical protein